MFCSQCGAELPDEARFCSECGSVVERPTESADTLEDAKEPSEKQQDMPQESARVEKIPVEQHASFAERLMEFRRTTLKAVPTFVLAIVAFLASAVTAYAAYKVVTEVVVPAIEHVVEGVQQNSGDKGGNGDAKPVVAKGKPQNMLQLGEILAMDPADIPDFLKSQGLVYMDDTDSWVFGDDDDKMFGALKEAGLYELPEGAEEYSSGVEFHDEQVRYADVDENGTLHGPTSIAPLGAELSGITLGKDALWWNHFAFGEQVSAGDLKTGAVTANSIHIDRIPLTGGEEIADGEDAGYEAGLNDDDVRELCSNVMGLGEPVVIYRPNVSRNIVDGSSNGSVSKRIIDKSSFYAAGIVDIKGEDCLWYLNYNSGLMTYAQAGVVSWDSARKAVLQEELYTGEEWDKATDMSRAGIFAQSMAAEMLNGNGYTVRLNYRTGKMQAPGPLAGNDTGDAYTYNYIDVDNLDSERRRQLGSQYEETVDKPLEGTIIDFTKQKGSK